MSWLGYLDCYSVVSVSFQEFTEEQVVRDCCLRYARVRSAIACVGSSVCGHWLFEPRLLGAR